MKTIKARIEIIGNFGFICSNNFPTKSRVAINLKNFLIMLVTLILTFFLNQVYDVTMTFRERNLRILSSFFDMLC